MGLFGGGSDLMASLGLDASDFESGLHRVDMKLAGLASRMGTIGLAAGVAFAGVGVKSAMNFESAMANVNTLMEDGGDAMSTYGDFVRQVAVDYGVQGGAVEVINGLYETLSAGVVDAADAQHVMTVALKSGRAGLAETNVAVDAITTVLNAYGLKAEEAERISDIMFQTVNKGKITFPELAGSIGQVTAIAPQLGVSFEEVGAAYATLTAAGINASESSTAVKGVMSAMLKPSSDLQARLTELGLESGKAAVEQYGLFGAVRVLTEGMSEAEIAAMFPNLRAMTGIFPILGSQAQTFDANLRLMESSAGSTDAAFAKIAATNEFTWTQAKNQFMGAATSLGTTLLPALTKLVTKLGEVAKWFTNLSPGMQQFILFATLGGFAALKLVGTVASLAGGFAKLPAVFATVKAGFIGLNMAMGPIGWAIMAIVAAVALLAVAWKNNWFDIQGKTAAVVAWLKNAFANVVAFVTSLKDRTVAAFTTLRDRTVDAFTRVRDFVKSAVSAVWNFVRPIIDTWRTVWTTAFQAILTVTRAVWNTIKAVIAAVFLTIVAIFRGDTALLSQVWSAFGNKLKQIWSEAWNRIKSLFTEAINNIRSNVTSFVSNVVSSITNLKDRFISLIQDAWTRVKSAFTDGINQVLSWMRSLPGQLVAALGNTGTLLMDAGRNIIQGLISGIKSMAGAAAQAARDAVSGAVQGAKNFLGIASPSKVFLGIGRNVVEGFNEGIGDLGQAFEKGRMTVAMPRVRFDPLPSLGAPTGATRGGLGGAPLIGTLIVHADGREGGEAAARAIERRLQRLGVR